MKISADKLQNEVIDLKDEIVLVAPVETPLYTMLASKGKIVKASDITVTWREKELDNTRGTLKVEGSEAGAVIKSTRSMNSNICQIMEKVTAVSGTARALAIKGIGDEFLSEVKDRMVEAKRDCEYYFLNGVKTLENGATPRQMGGLLNMVASANVIDLGAKVANKNKIEESDFLDMLQKMWEAGAQGEYTVFCNATAKRKINDLLKSNPNARIVTETVGDKALGLTVSRIETDFGTLNLVLNRYMPVDQLLAVDLDFVEIAELRAPFYEDLAKTGDYSKGHVIMENTIKLLNSKGASKIIGLTA